MPDSIVARVNNCCIHMPTRVSFYFERHKFLKKNHVFAWLFKRVHAQTKEKRKTNPDQKTEESSKCINKLFCKWEYSNFHHLFLISDIYTCVDGLTYA